MNPVPLIARPMHEAFLGQQSEYRREIVVTEPLVGGERQLEGRTLDVVQQNVQVVRVDEPVLG